MPDAGEPPTAVVAKAARRWPGAALRLTLAVAPLVWLARRVDAAALASRFREASTPLVVASMVLAALAYAPSSLRWAWLMRVYGATEVPSLFALVRHCWVGAYLALLPSGMVGDAVRGYRTRAFLPDLVSAYAVIVVERISGLVGLAVLGLGAVTASAALRASGAGTLIAAGLALALVLATGAAVGPELLASRPGLAALVGKVPVVGGWALRFPRLRGPRDLLVVGLAGVAVQLVSVALVALCVRAVAPEAPLASVAAVAPIILLLGFIPLTPAGFGQREIVFVAALAVAGVDRESAVAASELYFATGLVPVAVGAATLFADRGRERGDKFS